MNRFLLLIAVVLMAMPWALNAQTYTLYTSDNSDLPYNSVYCIDFDNNGNSWFGGQRDAGTGLANVSELSWDLKDWTVYQPEELSLDALEDRVFYIAVDDQNTKWFCTHYGVSYLKSDGTTGTVDFTVDKYTRTVQTDSKGNIYISVREDNRADSRIYVSYDHGQTWEDWDLATIGMSLGMDSGRPEVYDLREDSKGQLWLCTWYGVTYRKLDGSWHSFASLEGEYTYAMTIDPNDHVWVPDYGNIRLYEILPDESIVEHDSTSIEPLKYPVEDIESDPNGHIWCALNGGGLLEILPDGSFNQFTKASTGGEIPSDTLTHMEIKDNVIWVSTADKGVVRLTNLVKPAILSVEDRLNTGSKAEGFELYQNFPNPFNPSTTIRFNLVSNSNVEIAVYDILGNLVKVVASGHYPVGTHSVVWDGKNHFGETASSGIYIYRLRSDYQTLSRKMMLMK